MSKESEYSKTFKMHSKRSKFGYKRHVRKIDIPLKIRSTLTYPYKTNFVTKCVKASKTFERSKMQGLR